MQISDLRTSNIYKGTHLNVNFEIVHWGLAQKNQPAANNNKGRWNFYIYLLESELTNFNDFWIEPEIKEFSPSGTKYISYDYYASPLYSADFHGGITFWEGLNNLIPGCRSIKVGCDYSHLFDQERGYDYELSDVLQDCTTTIEQLQPLFKLKSCQ